MISIGVLGPVEVIRDDGRVRVPAGKATELLVRLAVEPGVAVRVDRLIEDLWGVDADGTSRNSLQVKVSTLRRALQGVADVVSVGGGYRLDVPAAAVDAIAVVTLAAEVRGLLDAGDAEGALTAATRAAGLFRGDTLCDAGDGPWVAPHRALLDDVRLRLVEDGLAARLQLGSAAAVVGELEALVAAHPLRERLWMYLMTALYRDGRQADALGAYRRLRDRLATELGVEPGADVRAVHEKILRADLDIGRPAPPSSATSGNLPTMLADLVGRAEDVREVARLLGTHRLVTVVGPAGVGKTRLSIEVARAERSRDGVWLVRLDSARSGAEVPQAFGDALTMSGATRAAVVDRVRGGDLLLVVDNCEHVLDDAAEFVVELLDRAPGLRVLATSQAPLNVAGEAVHGLAPLSLADAVTLFGHRAAERGRSVGSDAETSSAIEDLCGSLDGIPLAIELAAARTKALSVQEIARRIEDRFGLLRDSSSRGPMRHRALSEAIRWSYDLLFPDDQVGLWALACFVGGAPLEAAEAVTAALGVPLESALDVMGRLVDRSLVSVDIAAGGTVSYRVLDSVRAFALARLDDAGQQAVAEGAHAAWFARAAAQARADQHGPDQVRHLAFVRSERANIDAALAWAQVHDQALAVDIANGFGWATVVLGEGAAGAHRLRDALRAADPVVSTAERVLALSLAAWNEAGADVERARHDGELAVSLADATGDPEVIAASRFGLAFPLIHSGRAPAALALLDDWRAQAATVSVWNRGMACVLVGYAGLAAGATDRVRTACAEAAGLVDGIGDAWLTSHVEAITGQLAQLEGRLPDAAEHLERAAVAAERGGAAAAAGFHLAGLGRVLHQLGDQLGAIAVLERGISMIMSVGLMRPVSLARLHLGQLQLQVGDRAAARANLAAADAWFRSSGGGEETALAAGLLAGMAAEDGAVGAASEPA